MRLQHIEELKVEETKTVATSAPLLSPSLASTPEATSKIEQRLEQLNVLEKRTLSLTRVIFLLVAIHVLFRLGSLAYVRYQVLESVDITSLTPGIQTVTNLLLTSLIPILLFFGVGTWSVVLIFRRAKLSEGLLDSGDVHTLHHAISSGAIQRKKNRSKVISLLEKMRSEDAPLLTKQDLKYLHYLLRGALLVPAYPPLSEADMLSYRAIVSALGYVGDSASLRMLKALSRKQRLTTKFPEFHQTLQLSIVRLEERLAEKDTRDTLLRASSPEQPTAELLRPASEQHGLGNDLLLRPVNDAEVKDETKQELGNQ